MVIKKLGFVCIAATGAGISSQASAQLWASVDIVTKANVRVQIDVSRERSCLTTLKLSYRGNEIRVPKEAIADVCNILLEDIKVVPDETAINENSVAMGFKLTLSILPPVKPDDFIDDHQLIKYEFSFDENCLDMRSIVRWDKAKKVDVVQSSGSWPCRVKHP